MRSRDSGLEKARHIQLIVGRDKTSDYPGFPTRPFTWEEISAKFDKLMTGHVGAQLSRNIKDSVQLLEYVQVSDLTKLLREIN